MVYLIQINQFTPDGLERPTAELLSITTSMETVEEAVEWTLADEDMFNIRDLTSELLSLRDDCWFTHGPETMQ